MIGDAPTTGSAWHLGMALVASGLIVYGASALTDKLLQHPTAAPAVPVAASAVAPDVGLATQDEESAAQARAERLRRERALADEERARREQKRQNVLRARDEAVAATQAAEAAKEAAWQKYFTRNRKCDVPADDAMRVECSNQYIRAKERFEKLYAEGKLR